MDAFQLETTAKLVAENIQPIFQYYGWTYSFAATPDFVPTVHDIYLNIMNLAHHAREDALREKRPFSYAHSGRILVLYHTSGEDYEILLSSLEDMVVPNNRRKE